MPPSTRCVRLDSADSFTLGSGSGGGGGADGCVCVWGGGGGPRGGSRGTVGSAAGQQQTSVEGEEGAAGNVCCSWSVRLDSADSFTDGSGSGRRTGTQRPRIGACVTNRGARTHGVILSNGRSICRAAGVQWHTKSSSSGGSRQEASPCGRLPNAHLREAHTCRLSRAPAHWASGWPGQPVPPPC
jgi:hypothetical protein